MTIKKDESQLLNQKEVK